MAIIVLLIVLLILILAVIFAIQNSAVVPISYLIWDTEGSLAFILLLALIFGVLIGLLVTSPTFIRNKRRISKQGKDIEKLQAELEEKNTKLEMIEGQLAKEEYLPEEVPEEITEEEPEEFPDEAAEIEPGDAAELVEVQEESVELMEDTSPAEVEVEFEEEAQDDKYEGV